MKRDLAINLLEKTQEDYNRIAPLFSSKRFFIPEEFYQFLPLIKEKEKILDLGCGNGRLFEVLKEKNISYFGVDFSEEMVKIASQRYPNAFFQKANALSLPFKDNFFDKIFCFAVFHHIPSLDLRIEFLKEAKRVLKKEGLFIISVWNLLKTKKILVLKYALLKILKHSFLDFKDIFYPWKNEKGEVLAWRYFHCFSLRELKGLSKKAGFFVKKAYERKSGRESNLYLILQK